MPRQPDERYKAASRLLAARIVRRTLPKKFLDLLGKVSDRNLEKRFRISRQTIIRLRRLLKIEHVLPLRNEFDWTPARLKLLGRRSDNALAKKFGVRKARISKMRRKLRIKPYRPFLAPFEWTPDQIERLGEDTDAAVAMELGILIGRVTWKRRLLCIAAYDQTKSISSYTWTHSTIALLGKHSDPKVSRMLGLSVTCVNLKRRSLGIPPKIKRRNFQWTKDRLADLSKLTSREFSIKYGIPRKDAYQKRYALE